MTESRTWQPNLWDDAPWSELGRSAAPILDTVADTALLDTVEPTPVDAPDKSPPKSDWS